MENVQVYNGYVLHTGRLKYGKLSLGDEVISSYDEVFRFLGVAFNILFDLIIAASTVALAK